MANLNNNAIPKYQPDQPYHYTYDNIPLDTINTRELILGTQLDVLAGQILGAAGSSSTLTARLNQSLEQNGYLKTSAIDSALHSIAYHTDGVINVDAAVLTDLQTIFPTISNPVSYVKMLEYERDKLSLIADQANNIFVSVQTPSGVVTLSSGIAAFKNSSTINWTVETGQIVKAEVVTALSNPHQHYDNVIPQHADLNPSSPTYYKNYLTGSPTAFRANSLKVFINGTRIFPNSLVYFPSYSATPLYTQNKFTENLNGLGFSLLNAITGADIMVIDYEIPLGP